MEGPFYPKQFYYVPLLFSGASSVRLISNSEKAWSRENITQVSRKIPTRDWCEIRKFVTEKRPERLKLNQLVLRLVLALASDAAGYSITVATRF